MTNQLPTDPSRRKLLSGGALTVVGLALPVQAQPETSPPNPTVKHHGQTKGKKIMSNTILTKDGTEIFYKDWGPKKAQPIMFHHGWPLSSDDWDTQMLFFLQKGYRVVAHDRRGHGRFRR